jgi:hypothetical protein
MTVGVFKQLLPNVPVPMRVWRGPFRGAVIVMNPRNSLRKVFGLYEHELNDWLASVVRRVDTVLDVGANDGYFTFGCAAAFRRLHRSADILAFEPQADYFRQLEASLRSQPDDCVTIAAQQIFVGKAIASGITTLAAAARALPARAPHRLRRALVKIDVEGAELDVIEGATEWLRPEHYFLIEVHEESYLTTLKRRFADSGIALEQRDQQTLPFLGRERRLEKNWWLVSLLD